MLRPLRSTFPSAARVFEAADAAALAQRRQMLGVHRVRMFGTDFVLFLSRMVVSVQLATCLPLKLGQTILPLSIAVRMRNTRVVE